MRINFFKLLLLITVLIMSSGSLLAQYTWTKYPGNPVFPGGPSGSWYRGLFTPCVLFNADSSRFEMWFAASTNAGGGRPWQIGFSKSNDGIVWSDPEIVLSPRAGNWDNYSLQSPFVILENGQYKMWYTSEGINYSNIKLGYATSPDGINWTRLDNPIFEAGTQSWEAGGVGACCVMPVVGGYKMWYVGATTAGVNGEQCLGYATSVDGISWQRDILNNPVLEPGASGEWDDYWLMLPRVLVIDNLYYMWYGAAGSYFDDFRVGLATSSDGINWTKFWDNPILKPSSSGWDSGGAESGSVVMIGDSLFMFYDGSNYSLSAWQIGLATSTYYPNALAPGTYTIGTGGNFATIQEAFNKLETDGVAGNITFELTDDLYTAPTDTFGFKLNGPIPGAGPNSRVTIKPAENKNVLIQGSSRDQLAAINTSYVTIDGVSLTGPTTLTFHALYNNQFGWNAGIEFIDNSDHNIIKDITFISDDINRAGGGPGMYTRAGINAVADSNLIESNFIKKCGVGGIYLAFDNATLRGTGNIIKGNFIGSETDSLCGWGIQVEHAQNTVIENNIIQNLKHTPLQVTELINVGINSYSGLGDIIRNNVVHGIRASSGYTSTGILLSGGSGSNNMVYNNMVYDIQSTSTQSNSRVAGIQIWLQSNAKIYYNSVYLSGTGNGANPLGSAAFYIYGGFGGSPGIDLKNNIFVNTRDESPYCASAIYDYNIYNLTSDYNDLFYQTNQYNCLVRIGNTDYHSLQDWQETGKDINSISEMPNFIPPYLHIDTLTTLLAGHATPIVGIDTDIDGEARHITMPDIGADEFKIVGVEDETTLPTEFALEQNYPNPFNPNTTFRYSIQTQSKVVIKVYDILGNEIATLMDEEKSVGSYEQTWNAENLPSGAYFYQLRAGDFISTKKMILLK